MKAHLWTLCILLPILVIYSCRKDDNYLISEADFSISTDTLLFDTVFTTIGSATKIIKVYNNESSPILLDFDIISPTSFFRMNVDGIQGNHIKNVEIGANDSIYVFMQVTVDPDDPLSTSPFVIEDYLAVSQQDSSQKVLLTAWGQNANYISAKGQIARITCNMGELFFDDPKPYVIYGILVIDSCELIIPEGRSIHVHGGVVVNPDQVYNDGMIIVFPKGKITVTGTLENPVTFEGSRLEPNFDRTPGQWVGLRLWSGSIGNKISHALIKNSIVGIIADSASSVEINSSIIKNTLGPSILASHASIKGTNLLLSEAGSYNLQLTYGGDYQFNYCTLINSSSQNSALYINDYKCLDLENDPLCGKIVAFNQNNIVANNCIIYGPTKDEITLDDHATNEDPTLINYMLSHCIIRVNDLIKPDAYPNFFDKCLNCITYNTTDTLFIDLRKMDYRLDTAAVAIGKAIPISNINSDLLGRVRDGAKPDIGCYEFED